MQSTAAPSPRTSLVSPRTEQLGNPISPRAQQGYQPQSGSRSLFQRHLVGSSWERPCYPRSPVGPHVTEYTVNGGSCGTVSPTVHSPALLSVASKCPNLHTLTIRNTPNPCELFSKEHLYPSVRTLKFKPHYSLSGPWEDYKVLNNAFPNVNRFSTYIDSINDGAFKHCKEFAGRIQYLTVIVEGCKRHYENEDYISKIFQQFPNLKHLKLVLEGYNSITQSLFASVSNKSLSHLEIEGTGHSHIGYTSDTLPAIHKAFPCLSTLSLVNCRSVLTHWRSKTEVPCFPSVTRFSLYGSNSWSLLQGNQEYLPTIYPNTKVLKLGYPIESHVDDFPEWKSVEVLQLEDTLKLEAMKTLIGKLPNVRSLILSRNESYDSVLKIQKEFPHLRILLNLRLSIEEQFPYATPITRVDSHTTQLRTGFVLKEFVYDYEESHKRSSLCTEVKPDVSTLTKVIKQSPKVWSLVLDGPVPHLFIQGKLFAQITHLALPLDPLPDSLKPDSFAPFDKAFPQLNFLEVDARAIVNKLFSKCPNLTKGIESLGLLESSSLPCEAIPDAVRQFPNLDKLKIQITGEGVLKSDHFKGTPDNSISTFHVTNNGYFDLKTLSKHLKKCFPGLTHLIWESETFFSVHKGSTTVLSEIHTLALSVKCDGYLKGLQHYPKTFTNLRALTLHFQGSDPLKYFPCFPKLESLTLNCPTLELSELEAALKKNQQLKVLTLINPNIRPIPLYQLREIVPGLKILTQ